MSGSPARGPRGTLGRFSLRIRGRFSPRGLRGRFSPRGLRGRFSLRGRLLAISLLLLVVALLGSNALLITLFQRDLVHQLDQRLRTAATATARLTDLPDVAGDRSPQVRDTVEQHLTGDIYLAYLGSNGRGGGGGGRAPPPPAPPPPPPPPPGGGRGRRPR
ncbi:hypothetical protein ACFWMG_01175, partial [Streptomyces sp. NPDC127074]